MAVSAQNGYYGRFGGCFTSELLATHLEELKSNYDRLKQSADFSAELTELLEGYLGSPAPLFFAKHFAEYLKGGKIYLKREDLNYTGSVQAVNVVGQALLAQKLGHSEIIVESLTGAQAAAAAAVARHCNLKLRVQTGCILPSAVQAALRRAGAEVIVRENARPQDLVDFCLQDWLADPVERYYIPALPVGPHPLPEIVRDFQTFCGWGMARALQTKEQRMPDTLVADSALALGAFYPFLKTTAELIVVEPVPAPESPAPLADGALGVFQGAYTKVLQYPNGQARPYVSPCPELTYPAVPPELACWQAQERLLWRKVALPEILAARKLFMDTEGLLVSLRAAVTLAELSRAAQSAGREKILVGVLAEREFAAA